MFGTIRKHQTWLWAIIITFTIISFVVFFSPYSKLNPGQGQVRLGSINGKAITEEALIQAQREAMLQYFFMSGGRWPDSDSRNTGFDLERETYQWLFLMQKIEEMGIHTSPDMVVQVARNMLSQFHQAGLSTPQAFEDQVLREHGMRLADFQRIVEHYLGIQQLVSTLGAGGRLVTPAEARELWTRENQELPTEAVFFDATNYLDKVNVSDPVLAAFFTNRLSVYRIPERVQVKYVEFSLSNHLEAAEAELAKTNLNEIIDLNMQRLGTNFTQLGATPELARAKMREEFIRNRALMDARRQANAFASVLFDTAPARPENLDALAKERGLTVSTTEPFSRSEEPKGMELGQGAASFSKAAFSLNLTNDPFGGPVLTENGVYVLAFGRRVPSEVPAFEQVRERVTQDYKGEQAASLARQAGIEFHRKLTNAIAQGKEFAAVVQESSLKLVSLPPFSISTRSLPGLDDQRVSLNQLKEVAFSTEPGKVSSFHPTADGGVIMHVKAKLPVNDTKLAAELPQFLDAVRQSRQSEVFNNWFRKEAPIALRDTPLGTPRTQPPDMTPQPPAKS